MRVDVSEHLEPQFKEALRRRDEGDQLGAVAILSRLLSAAPDELAPRMVRGEMHFDLERFEEAWTDFQTVLESGLPANYRIVRLASQGLFHTLLCLGRTEEAIAESERYFSLPDHDPEAQYYNEARLSVARLAQTHGPREIVELLDQHEARRR